MNEYILHRLSVAGNRTAVDFTMPALDIIYQYSRGIPRLINIICDFLMLYAFAEETKVIDDAMAQRIVDKLDGEKRFWWGEPPCAGGEETGRRAISHHDVAAAPNIDIASLHDSAEEAKVVKDATTEDVADKRDIVTKVCLSEASLASDEGTERETITLYDPLTPDNEIAMLLGQIAERLDRLENKLAEFRNEVTKDLDRKLCGMANSLALDIKESRVFDFLAAINEREAGEEIVDSSTLEQKNPKKSLLRRLFRRG